MQTEVEAKWLEIDPDAIREALELIGAERIHPTVLMRRKNFDYPDKRLEKKGGWIRVRDEGTQTTLSYKELLDRSLHGTREVVVIVDNYDHTCEFFRDIGFIERGYQETKRELWKVGDVEVVIDEWPWIPPLVELEAPDERTLTVAAEELGLSMKEALHGSVETAYQAVYDVTDQEIYTWQHVTFTPVPDWLEKKRKVR